MDDIEDITLDIEGNQIKCTKNILMENSDYFRVMFEGNFIERHQTTIKLQDVDFKSLSIVLTLIEDEECILEKEDLLLVLQTACMLQFDQIRSVCIEKITEIMSLENCLKIWHITEALDLKPLYLKAKNLALVEFPFIKDTDSLLDLNINQLHAYLANIYLCTNNEFDVFTTCMKWFYENCTKEEFLQTFASKSELFFYFLSFVDVHFLSSNDIREIITYPDVNSCDEFVKILTDLLKLKIEDCVDYNDDLSKMNILLNNRRRIKNSYPCILIDVNHICDNCRNKDLEENQTLIDKCHVNNFKNIILFDNTNSNFKKLLSISHDKYNNLEGFHILGYKELIFLFGGEFFWGRGNWSDNFWVYDTIRERWERKTNSLLKLRRFYTLATISFHFQETPSPAGILEYSKRCNYQLELRRMPYGRRHFESCIADNIVYIIGGTGNFRVLQDNMFWYSYKTDNWSQLIRLPCTGRQIKCCEYRKQLFLLNISNKCGYLFNSSASNWIELTICDKNNLVPNYPEKYVVFSYEDSIYIKGSSIIKLNIIDNKLQVISSTYLKSLNFDSMESVFCNGFLYTIYKRITDDINSVVFEKFDVSSNNWEIIMECDTEETSSIQLCGEIYKFSKGTKLFSLSHYSMVAEDNYLTDFVL